MTARSALNLSYQVGWGAPRARPAYSRPAVAVWARDALVGRGGRTVRALIGPPANAAGSAGDRTFLRFVSPNELDSPSNPTPRHPTLPAQPFLFVNHRNAPPPTLPRRPTTQPFRPTPSVTANQERTPVRGEPECLLDLQGQDLIGVPLAAPNCPHDRVYVLPLLTILTNKVGLMTSCFLSLYPCLFPSPSLPVAFLGSGVWGL